MRLVAYALVIQRLRDNGSPALAVLATGPMLTNAYDGIDGDGAGGEIAGAGCGRWNGVHLGDAQRLTKTLIRGEKICVILSDWPSG